MEIVTVVCIGRHGPGESRSSLTAQQNRTRSALSADPGQTLCCVQGRRTSRHAALSRTICLSPGPLGADNALYWSVSRHTTTAHNRIRVKA